jgi:multiple sugar transport system substrate-binding protein
VNLAIDDQHLAFPIGRLFSLLQHTPIAAPACARLPRAPARRGGRSAFESAKPFAYIRASIRAGHRGADEQARTGKETVMAPPTRRSVLRTSLALAAAGSLTRPHIANAAATTAEVWFAQGFIPEEDSAFKAMAADYEKQSGNKIEHSLIPYAALRQKAISAISSGVVPDMIEVADFALAPLQSWDDKLVDVSDIVEPAKGQFISTALPASYFYNNVTKKRAFYVVPMKIGAVPFHIWKSLVEKGGGKISELPKTWDAFMDFFKPVQKGLRAAGVRNVYAHGFQLTANGVDPINTFNAWMIAYGGQGLVTPDGHLHTDDPHVKAACVQAIKSLTSAFKDGYVPPSCVNWNDADDNNAFHSKLMVMDFDGTISTELALFHDKEQFEDILTHGLPLSNDGKELPSQVALFGPVIPKGAKNLTVAKEFAKYMIQPEVLNRYLKGGLGRWALPLPEIVKNDPFWLKDDAHRTAYVTQSVLSPTIPIYEAYNPAIAQVGAEHVIMNGAFAVMNAGASPEEQIDKAFKRIEDIFAKYPIVQS